VSILLLVLTCNKNPEPRMRSLQQGRRLVVVLLLLDVRGGVGVEERVHEHLGRVAHRVQAAPHQPQHRLQASVDGLKRLNNPMSAVFARKSAEIPKTKFISNCERLFPLAIKNQTHLQWENPSKTEKSIPNLAQYSQFVTISRVIAQHLQDNTQVRSAKN